LGCYGSDIETPNIDRLAANGLRYSNFHTTAMCSPTRAALLTGRNHHAVGMGAVIDSASGFPGSWARLSKSAATVAQLLRDRGYGTFAVGKWHLTPAVDQGASGPFEYRPLACGFDRFYGFLGGMTNQFHPELVVDNTAIDPPDRADFHLSQGMVDRAIEYVRDHRSAAPDRPFFLYAAFGACHAPLHAPAPYIAKYRGKYDRGWDVVRAEWFARQKALGIAPADAELAPRNADVSAWDDLTDDERRVAARIQEVFAGFLDHTDAQIGRLMRFLEEVGAADNTLVVLLSDNGAESSGGRCGRVGWVGESFADTLASLEMAGSAPTFTQYAAGWAQVGNTPLKFYKHYTYAGGIRDPLIIHWPVRIVDRGGVRRQYHHVTDVTPTILELLEIDAPALYDGIPQLPLHGTSMVYTLDSPDAPTRKVTQYYEMLGDRALWHRGWTVVTHHHPGESFESDVWDLYRAEEDFSECHDLASSHPDKVRELIERWWVEAGKHQVLPLDDRGPARVRDAAAEALRKRYVFYQDAARVERSASPALDDSSHTIVAEVEIARGGAEGIILASGGRLGGYVLYVKDGRLHYEYCLRGHQWFQVSSDGPVPVGTVTLAFLFERTERHAGRGTLAIDGRPAGVAQIRTMGLGRPTESLYCGREAGTPVGRGYRLPFPFTGRIRRVVVEVLDDAQPDPLTRLRAAIEED
jgi:arylsulfatase A-like enzyme